MHLKYALLVSTKHEAEAIHKHDTSLGVSWRPRYRFSIIQSDDCYQFAVQHATYPHAQNGKGWGAVVWGEKYNFQDFTSFDALKEHLENHDMSIEGWEPAENEEEQA